MRLDPVEVHERCVYGKELEYRGVVLSKYNRDELLAIAVELTQRLGEIEADLRANQDPV